MPAAGAVCSQVSRLRTIIDLRSEYHLNNEQLKNVLGVRLQPADDKYYLIELIDDYRGATTITQTTVTTTTPTRVTTIRHRYRAAAVAPQGYSQPAKAETTVTAQCW